MSGIGKAKYVPWSYSTLKDWELCPKKFYHERIKKEFPYRETPEQEYGNFVHRSMAARLAKKASLPAELSKYEVYASKLESIGGELRAEIKYALTKDFSQTQYFGKDVWVRYVSDAEVIKQDKAVMWDWKCGKPRDSEQLMLGAAVCMTVYPNVNTVLTAFVYLGHNRIDAETYQRSNLDRMWAHFIPRAERLAEGIDREQFPPTPNGLCRRHCPVTHCKHHGR